MNMNQTEKQDRHCCPRIFTIMALTNPAVVAYFLVCKFFLSQINFLKTRASHWIVIYLEKTKSTNDINKQM